MKRCLIVAAAAGACCMMMAAGASADGTLGRQGQIAIGSDLQFSFDDQTVNPPHGDSESTKSLLIAPAADYFVAENVSLGGQLALGYVWSDNRSTTTVGLAPRIGYAFPISGSVAFWPRLSIGYAHLSNSRDPGPSTSGYTINMGIYAPFAIMPVDHFYIGIGPNFSTDLVSKWQGEDSDKTMHIGFATTVGGYF